jgi:uncharacterized repeat protein (TIGR03803 family)
MPVKRLGSIVVKTLLVSAYLFALSLNAGAQTYKILHAFTGGTDGGGVYGSVVMDNQGNLYGTTSGGGAYGYGTVFELSPNADGTWAETVLHSFMLNDPEGSEPMSSLIFDPAGNLYGTTPTAGPHNAGTAFELTPGSGGWTLSVLYGFCAQSLCSDGAAPQAGLIMDRRGALYGAGGGGALSAGVVVELSPGPTGWTESVLYVFGANNGTGGTDPFGGLLLDSTGDLYGTTSLGGNMSCGVYGCGVVYGLRKMPSGWKESVLHRFGAIYNDGTFPGSGRLALDANGNLYGTTADGGGTGCASGVGCGTVFKIARGQASRKEDVIHSFGVGANGSAPYSGLLFDGAGNAYGTTAFSGTGCECGTIYKLSLDSQGQWQYTVVYTFNGIDGDLPVAGLIPDGSGNLYGTTAVGGSGGYGVVFEITP